MAWLGAENATVAERDRLFAFRNQFWIRFDEARVFLLECTGCAHGKPGVCTKGHEMRDFCIWRKRLFWPAWSEGDVLPEICI